MRARLPRRLRGPAGPEPPERPAVPFDAAVLALPGAPAPKAQRQRGWLRFPRALVIGAATGGGRPAGHAAAGRARRGRGRSCSACSSRGPASSPASAAIACIVAGAINVVQGQNVHHYLPGSNWAGSFVHAGNLIWLGVVLLLADGVISGLGLRVAKPLRRRKLCATVPLGDRAPSPSRSIVGIDG